MHNLWKSALIIAISVTAFLISDERLCHAESPLSTSVDQEDRVTALLDSWHTSGGQKSLVISIRPDGWALVMWIQPGKKSTDLVPWKRMKGGILIEDLPRIRLWPGRHDQELRAELEPAIPELDYDPKDFFVQRFMMSRVTKRQFPNELTERPVPAAWLQESVGKK